MKCKLTLFSRTCWYHCRCCLLKCTSKLTTSTASNTSLTSHMKRLCPCAEELVPHASFVSRVFATS